jgi:Flp pilus assembly protein TadG
VRLLRRRGASDEGGQAILIMALGMVVLVGIAGLAIDVSNFYLVRRQAQNATDFAALAAGKQLAAASFTLTAPPRSGDLSVMAAHDFATLNGFPTVYSTACDNATANTFNATWFDAAGQACGATAGFKTKVRVDVPPVSVNGLPVPTSCSGAAGYSCFQVTVTQRVDTIFERTFGIYNSYFTVSAVVLTTPAFQSFSLPPPVAVYLYQPQAGCAALGQQCFDESSAPVRTALSCTGSNNCPTFWVHNGTLPIFWGTDGAKSIPVAGDVPTLQSNGDMVLQDKSVFCDPFNGAVCSNSGAVGAKGFSLASGSTLYCSGLTGGGSYNGNTACTNSNPPGALKAIAGQETSFSLKTWTPSVDTSGLPDCGALILNGGTVISSFTMGADPACSSATEPYVIQPGKYRYIVINHGTYEFESGLYDLTSSAPVNSGTGASYVANGIDHKNERSTSGGTDDFDLCNGGQPNSCPSLTAAVWIGHGGGAHGAFSTGTSGSCVGGSGGTTGGGGDATVVTGSGVSFRFESTAGGFVSTNEVAGIALGAPGVGALTSVGGAPILFDLENNSFIHLDTFDGATTYTSQFAGLIYQTPTATGGGVELNPGLASGKNSPALAGQIFAYSLTTFGSAGRAVDFTADYGGVTQPGVATSGKAETSLVSSTSLTQAVDASGTPIPGQETLTINYTDEWALDAYNVYLKVNNAQPVFFSTGVWNPPPAAGSALPPASNTPGDAHPAYPGSPPTGYAAAADPITSQNTDWTYTLASGAKFEVYGNWTWGHESDISGANTGTNRAVIKYTFPIPTGTAVNLTIFLTDGDHCGDYYLVNASFNNIGQPAGGAQSGGSVVIVR